MNAIVRLASMHWTMEDGRSARLRSATCVYMALDWCICRLCSLFGRLLLCRALSSMAEHYIFTLSLLLNIITLLPLPHFTLFLFGCIYFFSRCDERFPFFLAKTGILIYPHPTRLLRMHVCFHFRRCLTHLFVYTLHRRQFLIGQTRFRDAFQLPSKDGYFPFGTGSERHVVFGQIRPMPFVAQIFPLATKLDANFAVHLRLHGIHIIYNA